MNMSVTNKTIHHPGSSSEPQIQTYSDSEQTRNTPYSNQSPSSIVSLGSNESNEQSDNDVYTGNNRTITAYDSPALASTPLSVAWAPELFVKADINGDAKLTREEFTDLMAQSKIDIESSTKLFDSFAKSDNGTVSIDEFVEGVKNTKIQGENVFDNLINSLLRNQNGKIIDSELNKFLSTGLDVSNKYWAIHR